MSGMLRTTRVSAMLAGCVSAAAGGAEDLRLRVGGGGRYLTRADGTPFFWLGDTAWELFHRLNREDAELYLRTRAAQGYTVIQAVALAELDGLNTPNAYGHLPLVANDPTKPDDRAGGYWDHVDFIVRAANSLGLRVGLLPTWGDKWNRKWGVGPEIFTPENAEVYGEWIGRRYREAGIVWILGGDRPVESERHRDIIRAMARGVRRGDEGRHLITFHPTGGCGSAQWFHDEDWLDVNMRQNGHVAEFNPRYGTTREDYDRVPVKPVLDGEPIYEGHPISFKAEDFGHSVAADVRRPLYWDLFCGACGHTYGHHSVWQMWAPGRNPVNHPLMPWTEAILEPGAAQMRHGRELMESRPFLSRIPADDFIVPARVPTAVPGAGRYRFVATRDAEGRYAMVYVPVGRPFTVRTGLLSGTTVRAWWFNPRDGRSMPAGDMPKRDEAAFVSPTPGEALDWVLVLDDASCGFPAPGSVPVGSCAAD